MKTKEFVIIQKKNKLKLVETRKVKHKKIKGGSDSKNIVKMLNEKYHMKNLTEENAYVLAFTGERLTGIFQLSHGTDQCCDMEAKNIIKFILLLGADGFCVCHNHPNEVCLMSQDDYDRTTELIAASSLLKIDFYHHFIIGKDGWRCAKKDVLEMCAQKITDVEEFYNTSGKGV